MLESISNQRPIHIITRPPKQNSIYKTSSIIHIKDSLKNIGKSYKLEESLLKQELEHDEIYEDNWEEKENEWSPYLKIDVLSTAFFFAKYSKGIEELTGFGMEISLTLPSLENKFLIV